jgi:uncharacterized protein YqhQ
VSAATGTERKQVRVSRVGYGGQAVLEGVMMRGKKFMAVAVRAPDQEVIVISEPLPQAIYGGWVQKVPFLRGMTLLWDSLGLGMRALMFSADIAAREEAKPGEPVLEEPVGLPKAVAWTTAAVSIVFGVGLFFVLPLAVVGVAEQFVGAHSIWSNLAEGFIRLALLVAYVGLIGLFPDIARVYAYHGAEHMTIHAFEHGDPLDTEHVSQYNPAHPRCGTAFLLEVIAISIILFAFLGTPDLWIRVLSRILLIPVIAGIAYELLRLGGKYPNSVFMALVVAPGLALQKLTTRYPDKEQMQVAIASMEELLKKEQEAGVAPA